jgi:transposase
MAAGLPDRCYCTGRQRQKNVPAGKNCLKEKRLNITSFWIIIVSTEEMMNGFWLTLNVTFHYTPTSAGWLNQVERWFGIMSRKVLRGASFDTNNQLCEAIKKYIDSYNQNAEPFTWKKWKIKDSQIKDTIENLCN